MTATVDRSSVQGSHRKHSSNIVITAKPSRDDGRDWSCDVGHRDLCCCQGQGRADCISDLGASADRLQQSSRGVQRVATVDMHDALDLHFRPIVAQGC